MEPIYNFFKNFQIERDKSRVNLQEIVKGKKETSKEKLPPGNLENRTIIHQVHQFRCAHAQAAAVGYAKTPTEPSEKYPLQVPDCNRYGDDRRKDNGTPVQPQTQAMGAALSERQLG